MAPNRHGDAVVLSDRGVFITGASGAGKTSLALELVAAARAQGLFAALVADDQANIEVWAGRIVARAPSGIAGLVEVRGFGVAAVAHEAACVVDLIVELTPAGEADRMPEPSSLTIGEIEVPRLILAEARPGEAARAVMAWLALAPFERAGRGLRP